MADSDWMEIYRSYEDADLAAEKTALQKQATLYTTQNEADKSYTKDLATVKNRLHAVVRVQNERKFRPPAGQNNRVGVMDFSEMRG